MSKTKNENIPINNKRVDLEDYETVYWINNESKDEYWDHYLYADAEIAGGLIKVYKKDPWCYENWAIVSESQDHKVGRCKFIYEENDIYIDPNKIISAENYHGSYSFTQDPNHRECLFCIVQTWDDKKYYIPNWWEDIAHAINKAEEWHG